MVDYNAELLNRDHLSASFFHLDRDDPTVGFSFDASSVAGHVFPAATALPVTCPASSASVDEDRSTGLYLRLVLGSHLAYYLRHQLEEQKGYTSAVGISTNKLLSKLVGNVNKPKAQTTLLPPYFSSEGNDESNVRRLLDSHDIGKIPGIGFKLCQKIHSHILRRPTTFDAGLVGGDTKEKTSVKEVRLRADMGPVLLEKLLGGPGAPKGIGDRIWGLMNGTDDHEVCKSKAVPQQISIVSQDFYFFNFLLTDLTGRQLHSA